MQKQQKCQLPVPINLHEGMQDLAFCELLICFSRNFFRKFPSLTTVYHLQVVLVVALVRPFEVHGGKARFGALILLVDSD